MQQLCQLFFACCLRAAALYTPRGQAAAPPTALPPFPRLLDVQLAARSDVLVENFRPGVMEKWEVSKACIPYIHCPRCSSSSIKIPSN